MVKSIRWLNKLLNFIVVILFLLVTACSVLPNNGLPGEKGENTEGQLPLPKTLTDPREIELLNKIQKAAEGREDILAFIVYRVVIDHVDFSKDGDLALVWIALVDKDTGYVQPGEPGLVIANKTANANNPWKITFQADSNFKQVLMAVPDKMLSPELKENYLPALQQEQKEGVVYRGYRLPWTKGEVVRLSGSIGHVYTYKSCPASCLYAFDFANGTMFPVRAARRGVVKYAVWNNENGNPTKSNYVVLEDDSTTPTTYQVYLHLAHNSIPNELRRPGAVVVQGQFLGNADDTGPSTGHHLHFHVHTNATDYWGKSVDIVFDEVSVNGGRPRMCAEAKAFPQFGTQCAEGDRYVSRNSDAETPTGGISSPAAGSVITSPKLNVSGWMKDDVRVYNAQLMYRNKGDWKPIGPLLTSSPFTTEIDLCEVRIPNGNFSLSIVVKDQAGKISVGEQGLIDLTKKYTCDPLPPACVPADKQVSIYAEPEYQGECQALDLGKYNDLNTLEKVGANNAMSLQVGVGVSALLFPDTGFEGELELFQNGDADLSDNAIGAANAASIKVVTRIVPPVPPTITLPEMITSETELNIIWSTEGGVTTSAVLTGPGDFSKKLTKESKGSWLIGKLSEGEYSLVVKAVNLAGVSEVTQLFTVIPAPLPPDSHMESLPQISNSTAIVLKWVVESPAEEIDHFNLQWRKGIGDWQDWTEPISGSTRELLFVAMPDKKHEFRMRAVDKTGTKEAFPETAEAITNVNGGCLDDAFEGVKPGDDARGTASSIELGVSQPHNWCPVGDVDWVVFDAIEGDHLSLTAKPSGMASGVEMKLYDSTGKSLLAEARPLDANAETALNWIVPLDGIYHVKLTPLVTEIGGVETNYDFLIERKSSVKPGVLICGSAVLPLLLGGGYAASKVVKKRKLLGNNQ